MEFDDEDEVTYPKWERIFFAIGVGATLVGVILKYNSLPYARHLLFLGIGTALLSYVMGFFAKGDE